MMAADIGDIGFPPRALEQRRFTLPESVDAEAVKATGKHGVLEIVIPKREAAKPRKITVNS